MRRALAAAALLGILAGCAAPATEAPSPATAIPPTAAQPPAAAGTTPDEASCAEFENTVKTVKGIAAALETQPILPAAVAVFLLDSRGRAATPGIADPELAAAQAELVAAIDELDAQGRALLPPGGNGAQNPVQLDPARIVAAVEAVEKLCATPV